ncbi:MAG TPA: hypothetical protein VND96_06905 [Candidatus Micrarchaeaceae archaeon]|nr:hypothetical protein [Candidatus Micrarchaeaceae archaeon]
MSVAPEVKESFVVQSPSFIFGLKVVAEPAQTLIPLINSDAARLPDLYAGLAAEYRRLPQVEDTTGGLPGDRHPY